MNIDDTLRNMAAQDAVSLPQGYDQRLKEVCASLGESPVKTRKRSRVSRLLLAAALAVCCVGLVAMGTDRVLPLLSGGRIIIRDNGNWSATNVGGDYREPIVLEEGKLWLIADDQRLDLTELIDESTPYIYTSTQENSSLTLYVAVGGTPEDFGWKEWFQEKDGPIKGAISSGAWKSYWLHDGQLYDPEELSSELQAAWDAEGDVHTGQLVYKDWYLAALDQLGLERPEGHINDQWRGEF